MEIIKTRTGVVLTEIAGEYVLIAARSLLKECPYVTQINETSAFLWRCLENGCDVDTLFSKVAEEYEIDNKDSVKDAIMSFVQQMRDLNYIESFETGGENIE